MKNNNKKHLPLEIHADCQVEIRPSSKAMHLAYYYCRDCQKHVAWISRRDLDQLQKFKLTEFDA